MSQLTKKEALRVAWRLAKTTVHGIVRHNTRPHQDKELCQ